MHSPNVVLAETMGRAVRQDRQFAMPEQPRFLPGLVVVPLKDGLLIEGAVERQVLRGKAAVTLLPRLIEAMDGTRTLEQIAAALSGTSLKAVHDAAALLYTRGLVEEGKEPALVESGCEPNTLAFFHRYLDATRVNANAQQAASRLVRTPVLVAAAGGECESAMRILSEALASTGVPVSSYSLCEPIEPGTARLVVLLVSGDEPADRLCQLDDECARAGVPWLRAAIRPETMTAELGPYFVRGTTGCYRCFANIRDLKEPAVAQGDAALLTRLWANMLAVDAIYLVSRIGPLAGTAQLMHYDLATWESQKISVPRMPGCPHCRPVGAERRGEIETAVAFEDAVAFPCRSLIDPKTHQTHYRTANIELARDGKRYPSAPKVELPDRLLLPRPSGSLLAALSTAAKPVTQTLDLPRLTSLLMMTTGLRPNDSTRPAHKPVQRWAPTGGNLGSPELYVAVFAVAGLDPGIYFYQPHEHVLSWIGHAPPTAGDACALVFGTGALGRVAKKYGPFAYRVVQQDAGVAFAQLHVVATGLGLRAEMPARWDDLEISTMLGLDTRSEAVTFVARIYGK